MSDAVNNTNSSASVRHDLFEIPAVRYTFVALYLVAALVAAVGNGYLMFYIIRHRKRTKKNVTAYLILNLAFCDFIISLCTPIKLVDIVHPTKSTNADELCKLSSFFGLMLGCTTFLNIVAISVERLMIICYPLQARSWLKLGNTVKVLIVSWVISIGTALPLPILFTFIVEVSLADRYYRFCLMNVYDARGIKGGNIYFIILFILYYVIPVVVITVCYSMIFHTLYCAVKMLKNSTKSDSQQRMIETRKSLAKIMLFIAVSFAIFQGPYFITFLCVSIGIGIKDNAVFLLMIIEFLPLISAALNPIVYSVRTKTFKKSVTYMSQASHSDGGGSMFRRSTNRSNTTETTRLTSQADGGLHGESVIMAPTNDDIRSVMNARGTGDRYLTDTVAMMEANDASETGTRM